jgi:uncharacterized protein (TIGR00730 family)
MPKAHNTPPVISVFGGSAPKPGTPAYLEAQQLGTLLAEKGFTVQTGGYIGTMEAVSKGAHQAGGHVIGVTCDEIERWRPIGPNKWVREELRRSTLRDRLYTLIDSCHGAVALPGGIGTLAEIALFWSEIQIQPGPARPLILVGSGWENTLKAFFSGQTGYWTPETQDLIKICPDVSRAAETLIQFLDRDYDRH